MPTTETHHLQAVEPSPVPCPVQLHLARAEAVWSHAAVAEVELRE